MSDTFYAEFNRRKAQLYLGISSLFRYLGEGGLTVLLVGGLYLSVVLLE